MKKTLLILLLFPIFICSCQNEKEINNLYIVNVIGIDLNNNKYEVSIQILDTSKDSDNKPIIYKATGKNISEAINNITLKSTKSLYLGHLELLILGEKLSKNNVSSISDYFLRNSNISKNFSVLTTNDDINEILDKLESNSNNLLSSVEISGSSNTSNNVKFINFMQQLNSYKELVLPNISIKNKKLTIDNISIFKDNKLIGYLNDNDNIAYNFIINNIKSSNINYKCDNDSYVSINITKSNTNMKSVIRNDKPIINLYISSNAEIIESNCKINIEQIRKNSEEKIKSMIDKIILEMKNKYNSDIFGFRQNIYENHVKYFRKMNNYYKNYFSNLKVNIYVDVKLDNQGSILKIGSDNYE